MKLLVITLGPSNSMGICRIGELWSRNSGGERKLRILAKKANGKGSQLTQKYPNSPTKAYFLFSCSLTLKFSFVLLRSPNTHPKPSFLCPKGCPRASYTWPLGHLSHLRHKWLNWTLSATFYSFPSKMVLIARITNGLDLTRPNSLHDPNFIKIVVMLFTWVKITILSLFDF